MLKVVVTLHPFGRDSDKKPLHEIYVANRGPVDSTGCAATASLRRYEVWLDRDPRTQPEPKGNVWTLHDRTDGALYLVALAILDLLKLDYTLSPRKQTNDKGT